jgi:hypothetical protein
VGGHAGSGERAVGGRAAASERWVGRAVVLAVARERWAGEQLCWRWRGSVGRAGGGERAVGGRAGDGGRASSGLAGGDRRAPGGWACWLGERHTSDRAVSSGYTEERQFGDIGGAGVHCRLCECCRVMKSRLIMCKIHLGGTLWALLEIVLDRPQKGKVQMRITVRMRNRIT